MTTKGQKRSHSLLESVLNVLIGYGIAICAQLVIFPMFGGHFTLQQNLQIGALFTIVSLVRSYCLRRFFNWIMVRQEVDTIYEESSTGYPALGTAGGGGEWVAYGGGGRAAIKTEVGAGGADNLGKY